MHNPLSYISKVHITIMGTTHFVCPIQFAPCPVDVSVSLLAVIVTFCGVALLGVSLFVSWKLCWIPCRERCRDAHSMPLPLGSPYPLPRATAPAMDVNGLEHDKATREDASLPPPPQLAAPATAPVDSDTLHELPVKISHTSPDVPIGGGARDNPSHNPRIQRQSTDPVEASRHSSYRKSLPQADSAGAEMATESDTSLRKQEQSTYIGRIKPELYRQRPQGAGTDEIQTVERCGAVGGTMPEKAYCGKLNVLLRYNYETEQLVIKIHKAVDLPAKDLCGTSDPYVKIYLLPDRKRKFQTKVHRKTLNPVFDETFHFEVPYNDLQRRKLHFSIYDFDRFSRHDIIGQIVVDNLLEIADTARESSIWRNVEETTTENVELGELMFSLCYLPTAGRLTITIIKAQNLKAMDITGASDPYVKVSLICAGRRLKKRKTSTKRNTLNPIYNEEIVFDIPPDNMDQVNLLISVVDYDRVGHNEVIGVCCVGSDSKGIGRDHWNEMLIYPRKPVAHWHPLVEESLWSNLCSTKSLSGLRSFSAVVPCAQLSD
uniref:Synaptotagmin IXb n=1 Tax=Eptatretus burgeri TaxID=7764 RepID=A0A8C4NAV9_EPTBU